LSIDASAIKGRGLRRKFQQIRGKKEGGFTRLELLVVVAILATIYRHVEPDEYKHFVVPFKVSDVGVGDKPIFQAIVDGAGDTGDEELGELDEVRPT
jgi:hypothetical protein